MKRRGFTLIELLVVVAIIALLIAILLPSLGKARELAQRTTCGTNLKGIGGAMATYAHDAPNVYPLLNAKGVGSTGVAPAGTMTTVADTTISNIYGAQVAAGTTATVMGNMWILVLSGTSPKLFICKSDPAPVVNASPNLAGGNYNPYWNTGGTTYAISEFAYSYSVAYTWTATGMGGWWRDQTATSVPLMSDMAPKNGTGNNPVCSTIANSKASNSFTHTRDGQNVLFGDDHVDFARNPGIGQSNDNIFTTNGGTPSATGTAGTAINPPTNLPGGTTDSYDLFFVPVSDSGNTRS